MADLNALIPAGSDVQLTVGLGINEQGQIAAQGLLPNGDIHAFLLTPCDEKHPGDCEDYSMIEVAASQTSTPAAEFPAVMKQGSESPINPVNQFRNRLMQRYHIPGQPAAPRD